jgi:hypothetical protein
MRAASQHYSIMLQLLCSITELHGGESTFGKYLKLNDFIFVRIGGPENRRDLQHKCCAFAAAIIAA